MNPYTFPGRSLTESDVINTVAKVHNVPPDAIKGKSRVESVVDARHQVIAILVSILNYTRTRAGLAVSRHHSTATISLQRFYDRVKLETKYREMFIESCYMLSVNYDNAYSAINA